jgi:hypothetical protein
LNCGGEEEEEKQMVGNSWLFIQLWLPLLA